MEKYDVIVIGAGASGMMTAITASKNNKKVCVIEKNNECGKKINITGKGRCNITFDGDFEKFKNAMNVNEKFMYSSYNNFTNYDLINFLNSINVDVKLERGSRYFISTDRAKDVSIALEKEMKNKGVKIKYNTKVEEIIVEDNCIKGVKVFLDNKVKEIYAPKVVVATGGKSYTYTGSSGDGYKFAKELGHSIVEIKPALVGLKSKDEICNASQGLSLKNVGITVLDKDKTIYNDFGEMLFSHFGITGPIVLSSSSKINRISNLKEKLSDGSIKCIIDLKPALTEEKLDKRIQRDFLNYKNKEFKNALSDILPNKIISSIIKLSNINENKKVNEITKEERNVLVKLLKNLPITIYDLMPLDTGIVTAGGVNVKEINPKTMESKIISGLYFVGEVLDLDGKTGGFNLQIAFSTGFACGNSC